jgi:polyphenol oxidase
VTAPSLLLWRPQWAGPWAEGVGAAMSTRHGGVSQGPWATLNLGGACGDEPAAVAVNRQRFAQALGARPVWLRQVHGIQVLQLDADSHGAELPAADAAWTTAPGIACTVLVADCLPVLLAARDGRAVAAAHAGWRGLAAGVLEATVQALQRGAGVAPHELQAWLGPCIGPQAFEVGAEVLAAFGVQPSSADPTVFACRPRPDGTTRWLANLPALAATRLQAAGLPASAIQTSGHCSYCQASDLFSFRRDGVTGRMAAAIWRRG